MYSFRRLALLLAFILSAAYFAQAQSSSTSSDSATPAQDQAQQPTGPSQGELSVQARIRARREQRRAVAIRDTYDHLYEMYIGAGYLRFRPGITLQRVNEYDWNAGLTRYYSERLGVTLDSRGYYGTPFIEPIQLLNAHQVSTITKPAISQYAVLAGPTYRFYLQPKYSISGRVMGGYALGNFTGDTNGHENLGGLLYPDGSTFAVSASFLVEYSLAPNIGLRVAPEYYATHFGSIMQNSLGYTIGIVYRFGKQ